MYPYVYICVYVLLNAKNIYVICIYIYMFVCVYVYVCMYVCM